MRCAARRRQARRSRRCRRYRACGPAESCRRRYRTPVCRRRYALQSARTGRWSAAACPAWCSRRRAESPGRSNRRNPRPRAAASTARRGDPAWRRARRTRPARRGCRSRHVSRLRRRPILPSKCIQLLQPLPFLCFRICRLRGASRCPRSRRHACAVRAVTRRGRP